MLKSAPKTGHKIGFAFALKILCMHRVLVGIWLRLRVNLGAHSAPSVGIFHAQVAGPEQKKPKSYQGKDQNHTPPIVFESRFPW
jgi:hypothetical protein